MPPKAPQDHQSPKSDGFTWTSPKGVIVDLPSFSDIPARVLRANRDRNEVDFVFSLIEAVATREQLDAIDDLRAADVNPMFTAWAGVSSGESSGSSTS